MKKINIILVLINLIILILIILKISNQEVLTEYKFEGSEEDLRYELAQEIIYGEKGTYAKFNKDGQRVNTSEKLKEKQIIDNGLEVTDFNIVYENGLSNIEIKVKNTSTETKGDYYADLIFFDENDIEYMTLKAYVNQAEPGEEFTVTTSIDMDITNVYRCEIKKAEEVSNE